MDFSKKRNIIFTIFLIICFFVSVKAINAAKSPKILETALDTKVAPEVKRQGSDFVLPDNIGTVNTANRDNYIENALHQNGRALKFFKMPISVYIDDNKYNHLARRALMEWQKSTGVLSFDLVSSPPAAKIVISFTATPFSNLDNGYFSSGNTDYKANGKTGEIVSSKILILTEFKGRSLGEDVIYHTILHEIGHAIGINGHSDDSNDVMSTANSTANLGLSKKDIATVRLLYSQNNFERDAAVYKSARYAQIKQNLQRIPNDYNAWVQLGDFYFEGKYYDNAYKCFLYLTELNPNEPIGYSRLGLYYDKQNDFDNAFKNMEIAHLKSPSNPIFMFDLAALCYNFKKQDKARGYLEAFLNANPDMRQEADFVNLARSYRL